MKKIIIITVILNFALYNLFSQESTSDTIKYWKKGGVTKIAFNQVSLTNWAAGGENSYSLNSFFNVFANYSKENIAWENNLDLGYGLQKQGDRATRKTDDKIDLTSKIGYKAASKWYYSFIFNAKSQLTNGYKYNDDTGEKQTISAFLAPAYLIYSAGMEYKPSDVFYTFISPLTGKTTIVTEDSLSAQGAFGVDKGKKVRHEFGGFIKMVLKKEIMKNVTLDSKIDLYSNYLKNPQNIDVNWETMIVMKINDYLSANLNTLLIYDDDINYTDKEGKLHGPRVQFKEIFGVGLILKF